MKIILFKVIFLFSIVALYAQEVEKNIMSLIEQGSFDQAEQLLARGDFSDRKRARLLGLLTLRRGEFSEALAHFQEELNLLESTDLKNSAWYAEALGNLGITHWNMGNESEALSYLLRSRDVKINLYGEGHESLASSYNDIGLVLSISSPEKALTNYEKALNIYYKQYGANDVRIAQSNVNIGIIQSKLGLYGPAIDNFDEALSIWKEIYGTDHVNEAFVHLNLGQTYFAFGDYETAIKEYREALRIYQKNYGEKHPEVASTYNLIGNYYLDKEDYNNALQSYQKALVSNVDNFEGLGFYDNPDLKGYYSASTLLNSLLFRSRALEQRHLNKTLKFKDLKASLDGLELATQLVDNIRQSQKNEADKLLLGQTATAIYESGVRVAEYMSEVAFLNRSNYREKAFFFSEKSKASVLLEAISDTDAKTYANIPKELLDEEQKYKSAIAFYEQKLAEKPNEALERSYRKQLFELRQEYNEFIKRLETEYTSYFQLKYDVNIPSVSLIQNTLNENTAVISYFIDEQSNNLFLFSTTKKHFRVIRRNIDISFDRYISGLRNSIFYGEKNVYTLTASELSKVLMPDKLPKSITNLVIIPVGRLGVVPFEALLKHKVPSDKPFKDLPYWLNDFSISYSFSSTLYLQNNTKKKGSYKSNIFLCAPVSFQNFNVRLSDLPGSKKEIYNIANLFSTANARVKTITGTEATEELVKSDSLKDYRFIHFATHGVVDEYQPELSNIFLHEADFEDGYLYTGEILNLDIDADLVTLSACQTGLGKVSKGEGIIGLSRALIYAGAKNVVVSLWSVADESTSELMTSFYAGIVNNEEKSFSEALRNAKLKLLNDDKYNDPYYWAPFVLIGR